MSLNYFRPSMLVLKLIATHISKICKTQNFILHYLDLKTMMDLYHALFYPLNHAARHDLNQIMLLQTGTYISKNSTHYCGRGRWFSC